MKRILHVSSEVAPYSQTGGLGVVVGALPAAQRALGDQAVVLTPRYAFIDVSGLPAESRSVKLAGRVYPVTIARDGDVWFVDAPGLLDRDRAYGYDDDPLRFAVLCKVAALLAEDFDLVHLHDWQAALTALYLRGDRPTVQSVHNLAYQGNFPFSWADALAIPEVLRTYEGVEFHGQISLLKAGLTLADRLATVSPNYAREIQQEPGGQGLAGLFNHRAEGLVGVLNGIDMVDWDPATDPAIAAPFSAAAPAGKAACTEALRAELGLEPGPIFAVVSRAAEQKGLDLVAAVAPHFCARGARFAVLAEGEPPIEAALRAVAAPGAFAYVDHFEIGLARRIYAGADFVLVPSRFEPCGLTQMYAMRYGAIPIVRATGGLVDTVHDDVDGIVFAAADPSDLGVAIERALALSSVDRARLQQAGLRADWSWDRAAQAYQAIYDALISTHHQVEQEP